MLHRLQVKVYLVCHDEYKSKMRKAKLDLSLRRWKAVKVPLRTRCPCKSSLKSLQTMALLGIRLRYLELLVNSPNVRRRSVQCVLITLKGFTETMNYVVTENVTMPPIAKFGSAKTIRRTAKLARSSHSPIAKPAATTRLTAPTTMPPLIFVGHISTHAKTSVVVVERSAKGAEAWAEEKNHQWRS